MVRAKHHDIAYAYNFTGSPQVFHAYPGLFRIQLWGASGVVLSDTVDDSCSKVKSKGAYVSGIIEIQEKIDFFVYVGEKGKFNDNSFNGNIQSYVSGGGATDIRLIKKVNWYDFDSLQSRIMVAAGAGSGERLCGGDGGSLVGLSTDQLYSDVTNAQFNGTTGGTQQSGGRFGCDVTYQSCGESGRFGIRGSGNSQYDSGPSGGGGYYGGGGIPWAGSASGGSSFISGYQGCDAIFENSTEDQILHSGKPLHYSGKFFVDAVMIDGQSKIPSPDLKSFEIGHTGNGYALITNLASHVVCSCQISSYQMNFFLITNFYILLNPVNMLGLWSF
ncbi:hypothetical protein TVAG_370900 [Trichomonas vaginalis G3]|uniref:receptor protein-tyrosine kinase n=1 Tax=Trichomonas vaginalis (strain ATCC PRA-98 / G3) TaxID=412133 RepID=A2FHP2_TRIV3|nr:glycine-rich protein family [Trichomonas vaginalis G3]EAX95586.1 hypothetical protein TVAG_370900 [Trichomonas vaginalis G3]KAI5486914.1 glycine-rich protein family [Trichomonas vaginalis G3]|eukprot:XP_001308516.1 hypothetical protein [Trichomonas vaginalis G3]